MLKFLPWIQGSEPTLNVAAREEVAEVKEKKVEKVREIWLRNP